MNEFKVKMFDILSEVFYVSVNKIIILETEDRDEALKLLSNPVKCSLLYGLLAEQEKRARDTFNANIAKLTKEDELPF
jgi:hypothetical protein